MSSKHVALKRILLTVALASAASVAVVAMQPAEAQEPMVVKIATIAPEGSPWEKQLKALKSHIESKSGGRLRVKLFMGGSLGGEKALVRRTSQGTIQVFGGSTAALASLVPELDALETPYLFASYAQADGVLDNATIDRIRPLLAKRGFVFGLWAENGFRSMFTTKRQITTPADMRGLRMRAQESPMHIEMYRALGANPVSMDATSVLTSLQTDVVEGFDNTPIFAFATGWHQGAHFLTLTRHIYQPGILVFSKRWFDGLPQDLQAVLTTIPAQITLDGRQTLRALDPILIRNLQRAPLSIRVTELTEAQRQAFVAATSRVASKAVKSRDARALLQAIQQARARYH